MCYISCSNSSVFLTYMYTELYFCVIYLPMCNISYHNFRVVCIYDIFVCIYIYLYYITISHITSVQYSVYATI